MSWARFASLLLVIAAVSCGKGGDSVKPKQDSTAPTITAGPTVRSITETSATVTWFTDDASKSVVLYSPDMSFGTVAGDSALVTGHSVSLTGLAAGTTYHFRVQSCNAVDLVTRSAPATFATLSAPSPPSVGRIAFATSRDGNSELYVMNMDGTGQVRLTNNPAENMCPTWSPDRSKIAFVGYTPNGVGTEDKDIIVINADGSGWTDITPLTCSDNHPAWSPNGAQIAFSRYTDDQHGWDIYVMDARGEYASPLTWNEGHDDAPSWSPDGSKIAYTGTRDGHPELFVMNANGSGQTPLTQDSVLVFTPCWSPDGTRIAYVRAYNSDLGIEHDIAIINADGTNPVRVTHGNSAYTVSWDPDGAHLIYGSVYPSEIHRVTVDGTHDVNLTNAAGRDYDPDCR